MANEAAYKPGFWGWLNRRLPVEVFWRSQLSEYYAPKNFNFWYFFGSLAMLVLVMQLVTGIFLAMFYKVGKTPHSTRSNSSCARSTSAGCCATCIRPAHPHSSGDLPAHVPRHHVWLVQVAARTVVAVRHDHLPGAHGEAFMGYVLPWGNMSFWAATVIINIFGAIPVIGPGLVEWIRGDYGIADATLNRFFSLHVVALPLLLLLLVALHLVALHEVGSNNPDGVEIKEKKNAQGIPLDGIPFHPYYTVKDIFGVAAFLALFAIVVFFIPTFADLFLEKANFEPANPLSTPDPISPSWYFTPYYAILRSFPSKGAGAVAMLIAVSAFFFLPGSIAHRSSPSATAAGSTRPSGPVRGVLPRLMYLGLQPAQGTTWCCRASAACRTSCSSY